MPPAAAATRVRVYSGPYASLINPAAARNGLDPFWLAALLKAESQFNPTRRGQIDPRDRGLGQINSAAHPEVSDAQAFNPSFAIPWVARELATLKRGAGGLTGALRAYNTGSNAPSGKGTAYVDQVTAAYRQLVSSTAPSPTPQQTLLFANGVDPTQVDPRVVGGLYALALSSGETITVVSGRRTPAQSAALASGGGYANDPHTRGVAADAFVGSQPIGDVFSLSQLAAVGLQGGNVAGFTKNGPDPEHVQLPNAGVSQSIAYTPKGTPVSFWKTVAGVAQNALGGAPLAAAQAAGGIFSGHLGVPNIIKAPVDATLAVGKVASKFLTDPAYPFLWLLFMLMGFALIFVGLSRLFAPARREGPSPESLAIFTGAPAGEASGVAKAAELGAVA
jgi:hypothetical protein